MKAEHRQRSRFPSLLFIAGGFLLVSAIWLLLTNQPPGRATESAQIGRPLEDFSLTDLNGDTVQLSDYTGKVVLINAWATWCPPCVAEMPDLQAFYRQHQNDPFIILGINAGDSPGTASEFARQKGITFPILLDPNVDFLSSLGVHSFPTSILVGADGVVKNIHVGLYTAEDIEADITPYLK